MKNMDTNRSSSINNLPIIEGNLRSCSRYQNLKLCRCFESIHFYFNKDAAYRPRLSSFFSNALRFVPEKGKNGHLPLEETAV